MNFDENLDKAFSSDSMSDVLTLDENNILLITGLANLQLIRTAEMADINPVLLAREKQATPDNDRAVKRKRACSDENSILYL